MRAFHLVVCLSILSSSISLAQELRSTYVTDSSGAIARAIKFTCPHDQPEVCLRQCGATSCLVEESTCTSCAGTQSELLRSLFTKASFLFKSTNEKVSNTKVLEVVNQLPVLLLVPQSPFNFYTKIRGTDSMTMFQSLCPEGSLKASIVVELDESGYPTRPLFSVCEMKNAYQEFYFIEETSGL